MDFLARQNKILMPKYGTKCRGCPDENNNRSARCKLGGSDSLNTYPAVVERDSLVLGFFVVGMGTLVVCVELLEV